MIDVNNCFTYAYSAGTFADFHEAVTVAAISTNVIDLDNAGTKIAGGSKPPWLVVWVITAFASCVSMGIKLISDSVVPVLDASTAKDVATYRILLASLTANTLIINQPLGVFDYQRYLALEYEPYTNATAGTLCAYLSAGPETAVTDIGQTVEAGS
jgi:hypothetical protein